MVEFSGILFDKDGTLFDFHQTWGNWSKTFLLDLVAGDESRAREMAVAVGFDFDMARYHEESLLVHGTPSDIAEELLPYLPGANPATIVTRMNTLSAQVPQVEATKLVPLLSELRSRGLALGIATNDAEAPARTHLKATGIDGYFDSILGCDSGFSPKPAPDMLLAFAELNGLDPARVAMIGDSTNDLIAARSAGMIAVGVLTGSATRGQLSSMADVILPSIAGLPKWLDEQLEAFTAA